MSNILILSKMICVLMLEWDTEISVVTVKGYLEKSQLLLRLELWCVGGLSASVSFQ
jgi:hypothetical protein